MWYFLLLQRGKQCCWNWVKIVKVEEVEEVEEIKEVGKDRCRRNKGYAKGQFGVGGLNVNEKIMK